MKKRQTKHPRVSLCCKLSAVEELINKTREETIEAFVEAAQFTIDNLKEQLKSGSYEEDNQWAYAAVRMLDKSIRKAKHREKSK